MGHREGLLEVDVLAGVQRAQRDLGVLVVGKGDRHRIDVGAGEELLVVGVDGDLRRRGVAGGEEALDTGLPAGGATRIQIGHGEHVGQVRAGDADHVVALGDAAGADVANAHPVAGRIRSEQARGDDERCRQQCRGGGALLHEGAPRDRVGAFGSLAHDRPGQLE